MRNRRALTVFLLDVAVVFCALFLVVTFISVGAGLLAILAVFGALTAVQVLGTADRPSIPVFSRRAWRRFSTRGPPRF